MLCIVTFLDSRYFTEHLTCEQLFSILIIGGDIMNTELFELGWTITTALLLGGVATVGILALPWTSKEHEETMQAWQAFGTLISLLVRPSSPVPISTTTHTVRHQKTNY